MTPALPAVRYLCVPAEAQLIIALMRGILPAILAKTTKLRGGPLSPAHDQDERASTARASDHGTRAPPALAAAGALPQSIRYRLGPFATSNAGKPRSAEGAAAAVPRKTISNTQTYQALICIGPVPGIPGYYHSFECKVWDSLRRRRVKERSILRVASRGLIHNACARGPLGVMLGGNEHERKAYAAA
jgi:hypothetical protein